MSDEVDVNMIFYNGLLPEETKILKKIEKDVIEVLLKYGISIRPFWTSKTRDQDRIINLCLLASPQPRVIFELPSKELVTLTYDNLISRLKDRIKSIS